MKQRSGFTLVEMLVVVAIIGLLSSTILIGLSEARRKARDARRITDLRQVQNGLENYYSDRRSYPGSPSSPSGTTDDLYREIPGLPGDPQGGWYGYIRVSSASYVIGACLEGVRPLDVPSFSPTNASVYDVSPQGSAALPPPTCTCADANAYCVALGLGGR